jgi:hypothetical protein
LPFAGIVEITSANGMLLFRLVNVCISPTH